MATNNAGPVIRAVGTGGSYPNGVLSVSNNGTGDIARFGNSCCTVAAIDSAGNMTIDGDLTVGGQIIGGSPGGPRSGINWAQDNSTRREDIGSDGLIDLGQFGIQLPEPGFIHVTAWVEVRGIEALSIVDIRLREPQTGFEFTKCVLVVNTNTITDRDSCSISWVIEKTSAGFQNLQLEGTVSSGGDFTRSNLTAIFIPNRY